MKLRCVYVCFEARDVLLLSAIGRIASYCCCCGVNYVSYEYVWYDMYERTLGVS